MNVIINPGSGPVNEATESNATSNIIHFIVDHKESKLNFIRVPSKDYGDGRYCFLLWKDEHCHEIQMPGIPLDQVRFMGDEGQNVFNFPKLYVDDSSWLWEFALKCDFNYEEPK